MNFSVIIPVLNERACVPRAIASIHAARTDVEIIAVDGGSDDGSRQWLLQQPGVRLAESTRGKGPQQNAGARIATGEVLIFLHADCELPADAFERLEESFSNLGTVGGGFLVRFKEPRPASLHVLSFAMNLRLQILRRCFGDHALFVRRQTFDAIDGFPDWPLFEDYAFVRRMKRRGKFSVINSPITISARRFLERGVWRTVLLVAVLQVGFYLGVSPARLKRWFVDIRPHLRKTG